MRCACCVKDVDLCESLWIDGIKQSRICKDCLIESMHTSEDPLIHDDIWIEQLMSLPDGAKMLKQLLCQKPASEE